MSPGSKAKKTVSYFDKLATLNLVISLSCTKVMFPKTLVSDQFYLSKLSNWKITSKILKTGLNSLTRSANAQANMVSDLFSQEMHILALSSLWNLLMGPKGVVHMLLEF